MVVKHNIQAMNSNRMLNITTSAQARSTERLSSGYKINRASDDAAGLSISEKMRRQIRGLTQASANAQDGISCVQTAEGALNEVEDMLQRINELAVKGENGTLTSVDRSYIQAEVKQLMSEIDRVQSTTTFNEQKLLDGTFTRKGLQVGAESGQHITVTIQKMDVQNLIASAAHREVKFNVADVDPSINANKVQVADKIGVGNQTFKAQMLLKFYKVDTSKMEGKYNDDNTGAKVIEVEGPEIQAINTAFGDAASRKPTNVAQCATLQDVPPTSQEFAALNAFAKNAIQDVSKQRSDLGAIQNRLDHTINNLDNIVENTTSAEAEIRDTDIATEMVKYANNNILQQAGTSMLSQANQANQLALSLLG